MVGRHGHAAPGVCRDTVFVVESPVPRYVNAVEESLDSHH
jgi:hypothetical protein